MSDDVFKVSDNLLRMIGHIVWWSIKTLREHSQVMYHVAIIFSNIYFVTSSDRKKGDNFPKLSQMMLKIKWQTNVIDNHINSIWLCPLIHVIGDTIILCANSVLLVTHIDFQVHDVPKHTFPQLAQHQPVHPWIQRLIPQRLYEPIIQIL